MNKQDLVERYKKLSELGQQIINLQKQYKEDALQCATSARPCSKQELETMIAEAITDEAVIAFLLYLLSIPSHTLNTGGTWGGFKKRFGVMDTTITCFFASLKYSEESVEVEIQFETEKYKPILSPLRSTVVFHYTDLLQGNLLLPETIKIVRRFVGETILLDASEAIRELLYEIVREREQLTLYKYE